jgi:LuxR family maltose regulon positive regulatory protein
MAEGLGPQGAGGKFRVPPLSTDLIRRDRLTDLLEQATARPVTVVSASPGAGKTVACALWAAAHARSRRIAWLSLDEEDRAPARFWAGVSAALAAGGTVRAAHSLVPRGREADFDPSAALLTRMRMLAGSAVLVIDDMHLLRDSMVLPELAQFIHQLPPSLRLILSGRSVPGLHLARMRLDGVLSEIRGADLEFTEFEGEAYFDLLGLPASQAERKQLRRDTEGWMAGPRLAALIAARDGSHGAGGGPLGADSIVADYMQDEVLDRQPSEVRQFLRRTSVAEGITPSFADWLTGRAGSARILEQLNRENLFVSRDPQGSYRYHPVLRQVLLGELRCELPAEVADLSRRTARWNARHGDVLGALRCAMAVTDWEEAERALTEAGLAQVLPDRIGEYEALLGLFPAEQRTRPAVASMLAMARLCAGDHETSGVYLRIAADALDQRVPDWLVIQLWLAAMRVMRQPEPGVIGLCWPLAEKAQDWANRQSEHQALGLLWLTLGTAAVDRWEIGDAVTALTAARHHFTVAGAGALRARACGWLALATAFSGDLNASAEHVRQLRDMVPPDPAALCLAAIAAAQQAVDRDDLISALRLIDEAEPAAVTFFPGEADIQSLLMLVRARVALAGGDVDQASGLARLLRERHGPGAPGLTNLEFDAALEAEAPSRAAEVLGCHDDRPDAIGMPERWDETAARARLLLVAGDPAAALNAARECSERAEKGGEPTIREKITLLLAKAIACRRMKANGAAVPLLEEALAIAEPHDMCRPFLDLGVAAQSAIAVLIPPTSPVAPFAFRIRERFVRRSPADTRPVGEQASALTASELSVLRLLNSHMTNQEIADAMFLSVNTVKTHLRAVYHKLGVCSRRQAVDRGRRLQLI